jgi:hypothetical protein
MLKMICVSMPPSVMNCGRGPAGVVVIALFLAESIG